MSNKHKEKHNEEEKDIKEPQKDLKANVKIPESSKDEDKSSIKEVKEFPQSKDDTHRTKIEYLEKELSETKDKLLRALAENDNIRKRTYKELVEARAAIKIDTLMPFLKVFDHFQLAVKAADEKHNFDVLHKGMEMISSEFLRAFEELGIEKIDAVGKKFDPNFHEAVEEKTSENVPEGFVIEQWRCGYKMGTKVIQPATVVVSSGKEKKEENKTEDTESAEVPVGIENNEAGETK